jgi:hypothetical protein
MWGADGFESSDALFPGDNGNWTNYDNFLTQVFQDMQSNDMLSNVYFDIWNEPDVTAFWPRPQSQWIQMWGRGFHAIQ